MNHAPQIHSEITVLDINGKVRERIVNSERVMQDYKIAVTVKNQDGSVASRNEIPFKSFLGNFAHLYNDYLFAVNNATKLKITNGAAPSARVTSCPVLAIATDDTYGILVGLNDSTTGSVGNIRQNVDSLNDYTLRHKLTHGLTGANTLDYKATTLGAYVIGQSFFEIVRTFVNSSGSTIIVGEVGLVGKGNTVDYTMLCRDVNNFAREGYVITVLAGQTLEVRYTFDLSSAGLTGVSSVFNQNFLSLMRSDMAGASQSFVTSLGALATVDMAANPTYRSALSAADASDYGILIAINNTNPTVGYQLSNLQENYYLNTTLSSSGMDIALAFLSSEDIIPVFRVTNETWASISIGSQRDIKNTSAGAFDVNQAGLFIAGSGASNRLLIMACKFPKVTLAINETIKVSLRMVFPNGVV